MQLNNGILSDYYHDGTYKTTDMSPTLSSCPSISSSSEGSSSWDNRGVDEQAMLFPETDTTFNIDGLLEFTVSGDNDYQQQHHPSPYCYTRTEPAVVCDTTIPMQHFDYDAMYQFTAAPGKALSTGEVKQKRRRVQSKTQRSAANVRERKRMFHLNEAFDVLRQKLPAFNYEKRMSRIDTLKLAMTYIAFMKDVTDGGDPKNIQLYTNVMDEKLFDDSIGSDSK